MNTMKPPFTFRFYEMDAYGIVWHGYYIGLCLRPVEMNSPNGSRWVLFSKKKNLLAPVGKVDLRI